METAPLLAQVLLGDSPLRKLLGVIFWNPMSVTVLQQQNYFTLAINVTDMVSVKGKES